MKIIYLLSELIPCLLIGYLLGKYKQNLSVKVASPLIRFGVPISLMGILLTVGIDFPLIHSAVMSLVSIGLLMTIISRIPILRKNISGRTLQLGSGFGNTCYIGVPVSLALLPKEALSYSIGYDLGATLVIWSLGPLLLTDVASKLKKRDHFRNFSKAITSSPASKGLIGALVFQATPWTEQITSFLWIPSKIVIILALVVVGMRLGALKTSNLSMIKSQFVSIQNSLFIKLIGFPILMISLCLIFKLPEIMRNALVLQAATPTAIAVLLIAQAKSKDEEKATLLVLASTLAALITIPVWSLILKV